MPSENHLHRLGAIRLASLVFPPGGLLMLWWSPQLRLRKKVIGTIGIGLYSVLYAALLLWLLHEFFGLGFEMRGRPIPIPTFSKNVPNYDALESNRARPGGTTVNVASCNGSNYWTNFRGPARAGQYHERPIQTNWPRRGLPSVWRQPVGGGYASFVIGDCRAFTIEQRRDREAITAYDTVTGRELWSRNYPALFQEWMGGDGPRATPTYAEMKIYSLGARGEIYCVAATNGEVIWNRNVLDDTQCANLPYGLAGSPLVVGEKVIVSSGEAVRPEGRTVIAYNKRTGEPVWKSSQEKMGYASPMLVALAGETQLVFFGGRRVIGLSVEDGALLWDFPWPVAYDNNIAQPLLLGTNRLFISSGYGAGCAAIEIERHGTNRTARSLWRNRSLKNKFTSSVLCNGYIYGLDEDMLTCLDAQTGERKWKEGRYGYGQLLLAGDYLVILTGDGQLALIKATPDGHVELARFQAIRGKTWNHPAIADGKLFVRNSAEMACFDISLTPRAVAATR